MFLRGDLPVHLNHSGAPGERPKSLQWFKEPEQMEATCIAQLLSKFALGLPLLDQRATSDLLTAVKNPDTIHGTIFTLVRGIRSALYTSDVNKHKTVLRLLSQLSMMGSCGPALVPFYRQMLPPLRKTRHCGLQPDVSYDRGKLLSEVVENTLNDLERTGGSNAYVNIKYIIPTYDSYFRNY
uniref:TAF6_C domain-containing protein n=1 Tax=Heterorhabditis bacteriophora TaxID=37862 RepID=A0A1I7XJS8_HETBA